MVLRRLQRVDDGLCTGNIQPVRIRPELLARQHPFHDGGKRGIHILRQKSAGSTRIGNQFLLIQALCDFLHLYGGQAMVEVRIRLKSGQVIQSRSPNLLRPAADRRDAGFPCRLAVLVQLRRIPMLLKIFGAPHLDYPVVFADADEYRPAVGTYVVLPFPITSAYGRQHRCLHPAQRVVSEAYRLAHGIT